MTDHTITNAEDAIRFLTGGNANITLVSKSSGQHFTFKAQKPTVETEAGGKKRDHDADIVFVKSLHGDPNNWQDWHFTGFFFCKPGEPVSRLMQSKKAREAGRPKTPAFKAFEWALAHIAQGTIPEQLEVLHGGQCCRCGREITHPDSIARGIGPECAKHFDL